MYVPTYPIHSSVFFFFWVTFEKLLSSKTFVTFYLVNVCCCCTTCCCHMWYLICCSFFFFLFCFRFSFLFSYGILMANFSFGFHNTNDLTPTTITTSLALIQPGIWRLTYWNTACKIHKKRRRKKENRKGKICSRWVSQWIQPTNNKQTFNTLYVNNCF